MKPQAVEFLVHMSLATAAAAVNSLAEDVMVDEMPKHIHDYDGEEERYSTVSICLNIVFCDECIWSERLFSLLISCIFSTFQCQTNI